MLWTLANALERHLFTTLLTVVLLGVCAGLSWWIWLDRSNRVVPGSEDLIELQGVAHAPQVRNRPNSVWFRFEATGGQTAGHPAPSELRVGVRDATAVEAVLKGGPIAVVARVVRSELDQGVREAPPSVLELRAGDRMLVPLSLGQELRAEQAANARLASWIAIAGVAVSLLALILHWVGKLRA